MQILTGVVTRPNVQSCTLPKRYSILTNQIRTRNTEETFDEREHQF